MAVDLETLEIKIEASASGAAKSLDELAKSLKNVKNAMGGAGKTAGDIDKVGKAAETAAKGVSKAKTETKEQKKEFDAAAGSAKKFSMSLSDITKATGKVESGIKGIFGGLKTGSISGILGGIGNLKGAFSSVSKESEKSGKTLTWNFKDIAKQVEPAKKSLSDMFNGASDRASSMKESLKGAFAGIAEKASSIKDSVKNMFTAPGVNSKQWKETVDFLNSDKFNNWVKGGGIGASENLEETAREAERVKESLGEAGDTAGQAGSAASASVGGWYALAAVIGVKVLGAVTKVFFAYQKLKLRLIAEPFKALVRHAQEAVGKVTQLFSALKRIATYRLMRTFIKEIGEGFSTGLENAYRFSQLTNGSLATSLDLIATEFLYLKNSIGAAVAPLINALAPAVEFVIDKFVGLINVVNQFLSALGIGGKWIKAVKYPTTYKDALDDATGSAKELKRTILGIDELNPLNGDSGGSGKSGKKAENYGAMFEYAEIAPQVSDFAGQIKKMIEGGKWEELGGLLANKINKLVKTADGKIRWENGIGEKIKEFLGAITGVFNGFLKEFDDYSFGELIGDAIQTAFNTADELVKDIKWGELAAGITDFFDGLFERIDGEKIGKTINHVLSVAMRTLTSVLAGLSKNGKFKEDVSGFISGLDLPGLLSDFKLLFASVGAALEPIIKEAFKGIGKAIWSAIWTDMTKTDYKGVPEWQNVLSTLDGVWLILTGNITEGLFAIFGDDLVAKVVKKIKNVDWSGIGEAIKKKIAALFAGIEYTLKSAWNNIMEALASVAFKSKLTSPLGVLFSSMEFDLGQTGVGKAAEQTKDIYDTLVGNFKKIGIGMSDGMEDGLNSNKNVGVKFAKNTENNVNNNLHGKDDGTNYNTSFQKGVASTKGLSSTGKTFSTNLTNALKPTAHGESTAADFRTGVKNKLTQGFDGKSFTSVGPNLNKALNLGSAGGSGGTFYRKDLKGTLLETFNPSSFSSVGTNLNKAIDPGAAGGGGGKFYRKSLKDKLLEFFSGSSFSLFGANLNKAINPTGAGVSGGGLFKTGLIGTLNTGYQVKKLSDMRTNLNSAADLGSAGKTSGGEYRKSLKDRLLEVFLPKSFTNVGTNLNNAVGLKGAGSSGAGDYRTGVKDTLGEKNLPDGLKTALTNFGSKISKAVLGKGAADGSETATSYRRSMDNAFSGATSPEGAGKYGEKVSTSVITGANPSGTAGTIADGVNTNIDSKDGGGETFGKAVKTSIKKGINTAGIATDVKTSLSNNLPSNTTIGQSFGTAVGKNIATRMKSGFNNNFSGIVGSDTSNNKTTIMTMTAKASGGVLDYPGQLFIANEAGPELVGNIGRKTAVANTTQMVDAMAQGVYQANAESNMLLRQIIQYAAEIAAKEYAGGGEVTVESITNAMTRNNRRVGKTMVAVGV